MSLRFDCWHSGRKVYFSLFGLRFFYKWWHLAPAPVSNAVWSAPVVFSTFTSLFLFYCYCISYRKAKGHSYLHAGREIETWGLAEEKETTMVSERMTEMHSPLQTLIIVNVNPATHSWQSFLIYFIPFPGRVCPSRRPDKMECFFCLCLMRKFS